MINRYNYRNIFNNDLEQYKDMFKERNVKYIKHYSTAKFKYPNANELAKFDIIEHTWIMGDKFSKLAQRYYGDPNDWWIIAKFNQKPTESHVALGEIIRIPTPVSIVLNYMLG